MSTQPAPAPLLIACALGIERLALRTSDRSGSGGPVTVLRTGMGGRISSANRPSRTTWQTAMRSAFSDRFRSLQTCMAVL